MQILLIYSNIKPEKEGFNLKSGYVICLGYDLYFLKSEPEYAYKCYFLIPRWNENNFIYSSLKHQRGR